MGRLWVGGQRDVIQLAQAEPFSVHGHSEFAKIDGLHGSLSDLVGGGGWHVALRRQSRHDDSAGTTTTGKKELRRRAFGRRKQEIPCYYRSDMLRIAQTALAFSYIKQGKNAAPSRSSVPPSSSSAVVVFR